MGPAEAEAAMIHLLAEGRTAELQQVLAALPEPTPFAEVIDADLRSRALAIDLPALQSLEARVCADAGGDATVLRWWLGAVMAGSLTTGGFAHWPFRHQVQVTGGLSLGPSRARRG
jgi:hypothetical protein